MSSLTYHRRNTGVTLTATVRLTACARRRRDGFATLGGTNVTAIARLGAKGEEHFETLTRERGRKKSSESIDEREREKTLYCFIVRWQMRATPGNQSRNWQSKLTISLNKQAKMRSLRSQTNGTTAIQGRSSHGATVCTTRLLNCQSASWRQGLDCVRLSPFYNVSLTSTCSFSAASLSGLLPYLSKVRYAP